MHETMVAKSLLTAILAETDKQNTTPVSAKISCGRLHALNEEVLRFAFEAVAKGTPCEDVKIEVVEKPLQAKCRDCGKTFDFNIYSPRCPDCESEDVDILPDAPLLLEEIEFQES